MLFSAIVLHRCDNVATCLKEIPAGSEAIYQSGDELHQIRVKDAIGFGHKFAIRDIGTSELILKYGHPIGIASAPIGAGEYVHIHNVLGLRCNVAAACPRE